MVGFVGFTFSNPIFLWFLLSIPILILTHLFTLKYTRMRAFKFANFEALQKIATKAIMSTPYRGDIKNKQMGLLFLRLAILSSLILAVSGTVLWYTGPASNTDYVLAIDSSSSMAAKDFDPNRFEAAKTSAQDFVDSMPVNTRIGLVSFAGTAVVERRLTNDKADLKKAIGEIQISDMGGTAIGDAIITSSNLLVNEDREKAIILITDGQSNVGMFLEDGTAYAMRDNIAVYTIGIGTTQGGQYGNLTEVILKLNEADLKFIANVTTAQYYHAQNAQEVTNAYLSISKTVEKKLSANLSVSLLLVALVLLFFEWSLVNVRYRTIP